MAKNTTPNLGDIYGDMLAGVQTVTESATIKKGGNDWSDKVPAPLQDGGAKKGSGFHASLNDAYGSMYEEDEENEDIEELEEEDAEECAEDCECEKCCPEEDEEKCWDGYKKKGTKQKGGKTVNDCVEEDEECEDEDEDGEDNKPDFLKKKKVVKESKKISKQKVNSNMSRKTTFDKLYESVMNENFGMEDEDQDLDALGLGDEPSDDEMGDDFGGEEEDSVTFTLDRATAQALCDVLKSSLGEEGDDLGEEGDDLDFGDEGGDEMDFDEDEEGFAPTDDVGNDGTEKDITKGGSHPFQGKNNKVGGKPKPSSSKASSHVMDKVGNDGTKDGEPNYGKQNKVSNVKQGQDFFR